MDQVGDVMGKLSFASLDWVAQSRHKLPGDCETIPPRSGQNAGANIDSALYLDVRQFKRKGLLCAGRSFGWRWTFMDDTSARISVWVKPDQLTLVYSHYLN